MLLVTGEAVHDGARWKQPPSVEFPKIHVLSSPGCACGSGVQGDFCELGVCAKTSCNEPFGGVCLNGTCACLSGYAGRSCERPPETDQFGCYSQEEAGHGGAWAGHQD